MEEKQLESTTQHAATPVAHSTAKHVELSTEVGHSRRRSGGQKRKASNTTSGNPSLTHKRLARDRPPLPLPPIHNGPCTRARQTPSSLAQAAIGCDSIPNDVSRGHQVIDEPIVAEEPLNRKNEDLHALELLIDADFEAIRSRDSNVHVVPMHCGWFSWMKVHHLEERMLPSFFNGKTESRSAALYLEIRNWIMKWYHANPCKLVELKDLSELSVGDSDARQEVMEFLEYWGLINFNPVLQADPRVSDTRCEGTKSVDSQPERLYCFEEMEMYPLTLKANIKAPALLPGLISESSVAKELVRRQGPAVEYHCNFCSADCSRKRYHCQKQADFDLCMECFNKGKLNSDMSPSDFILMEPGEVLGLSSGKWTDQETLLLLEALELYKENWNEIAEHVATKTKAQCMLHFIQMPIEDKFLNPIADTSDSQKGTDLATVNESTPKDPPEATSTDQPFASNEDASKSVPKDPPETTDKQPSTSSSPMDTSKSVCENPPDPPEATDEQPSASTPPVDMSKDPEESTVMKSESENNEELSEKDLAVMALKEAFESVGALPADNGKYSFSEAGNPVMALAAFIVRAVDSDFAAASVRCSLKSLSTRSPGMELSMRHCFILEDPPVEAADSVADITGDKDAPPKDEDLREEIFVSSSSNENNDNNNNGNDSIQQKDEVTDENGSELAKEPQKTDEEDKKADSRETEFGRGTDMFKLAATAAVSAAAVKAKFLVDGEEERIRQLAASVVDKQLVKLETKMSFFTEMENVIAKVREQVERSRQKLYHERAQIIAARLAFQALSKSQQNRTMPSLPVARPPSVSAPPGMAQTLAPTNIP